MSKSSFNILVGYLVLKVLMIVSCSANSLKQNIDICSTKGLQEFLNDGADDDAISLVYQHCRGQFLEDNKLNENVKQTVDGWIGTDLSKTETNQIFLIYELALTTAKPDRVDKQFKKDCKAMENQFELYLETIEPLSNRLQINFDLLLATGKQEIEDQERELFNFVQYSQFCRLLLMNEDLDNQRVSNE